MSAKGTTIVSLVCEDLAQIDDVAEMLRSVGPTIVVTPLLDGPQLSSRWAARYAGVLADDPGSAVLTLSSFGMVQRSRPSGRDPSPVIGLWKDSGRGMREIPLAPGAHGVLVSVSTDRAIRRTTDGRLPVENGNEIFDMSVYQVHAASTGSAPSTAPPPSPGEPALGVEELTILTSWAEAVAESLHSTAGEADAALADAAADAPWRAALGLPEPSDGLSRAIASLIRLVRTATADDRPADALLLALRDREHDERGLDSLVLGVLRSALEQRVTREARDRGRFPAHLVG